MSPAFQLQLCADRCSMRSLRTNVISQPRGQVLVRWRDFAPKISSRCGGFSYYVSIVVGVSLFASTPSSMPDELYGAPIANIAVYLDKLVSSYPDWISARTNEYLIMKNGVKFGISDHRNDKSFNELLEHPDVDDMFYVPYPAGSDPKQPPKNFDPGRVRFEPLFTAMYGDCRKDEVRWSRLCTRTNDKRLSNITCASICRRLRWDRRFCCTINRRSICCWRAMNRRRQGGHL
jgi:hypothetical protein